MNKQKMLMILLILVITYMSDLTQPDNIIHATGGVLIMGDSILRIGKWLGSIALCIVIANLKKENQG